VRPDNNQERLWLNPVQRRHSPIAALVMALSGCVSTPVPNLSLAERCGLDNPADWHEIHEPPEAAAAIARTLEPESFFLREDSKIHWLTIAGAGKLAVCWKSPRETGRCGGTSIELVSIDGQWQARDLWNIGLCMG
jgi:hypothetical protein